MSFDPKFAKYLPISPSHQTEIKIFTLDSSFKTCLANKIRVYGDILIIEKIFNLVDKSLPI